MSYCDSLIATAITTNCDAPLVSGLETEGIIINRSDIDFGSCTLTGNKVSAITLKTGKKAYKITQPSGAPFTGTQTSLATGTYYNSFTHNVGFVVLDNTPSVTSDIIDGLANGSFVIILENKAKDIAGKTGQEFQIYGWHQGLKATEITEEKYSEDTDGGWAVTMEESKAPLSAMFFFSTDYATTKTAIGALMSAAV